MVVPAFTSQTTIGHCPEAAAVYVYEEAAASGAGTPLPRELAVSPLVPTGGLLATYGPGEIVRQARGLVDLARRLPADPDLDDRVDRELAALKGPRPLRRLQLRRLR